jgi:hypothetical protein
VKTSTKKRRKPGPPRTTGPGEQVVVRLHDPLLVAIDDWRSGQDGEPTRAEALRRLAARGLATSNRSWLEQDLEPIRGILRDALAMIDRRVAKTAAKPRRTPKPK